MRHALLASALRSTPGAVASSAVLGSPLRLERGHAGVAVKSQTGRLGYFSGKTGHRTAARFRY